MPASPSPSRGAVVVAAGTAVNLCLGILYAWSVWKAVLVAGTPGNAMAGANAGWHFLSDTEATTAYAVCGLTFAVCMIPGGRVRPCRIGPARPLGRPAARTVEWPSRSCRCRC